MIQPVARCPDCGWSIYDGHVSHRCPEVFAQDDFCTISFGPFDSIVLQRKALAAELDADSSDVNGDSSGLIE